jgi:hypothetical protein
MRENRSNNGQGFPELLANSLFRANPGTILADWMLMVHLKPCRSFADATLGYFRSGGSTAIGGLHRLQGM